MKYTLAVLALLCGTFMAGAQTNMPDPSTIYTSLYTPFSVSLTWVISAVAVLTVIGWILKAVRRR